MTCNFKLGDEKMEPGTAGLDKALASGMALGLSLDFRLGEAPRPFSKAESYVLSMSCTRVSCRQLKKRMQRKREREREKEKEEKTNL